MRIVIIEDEKLTAANLAETIIAVVPDARITAILSSVSRLFRGFSKTNNPILFSVISSWETAYALRFLKIPPFMLL